MIVDGLGHVSLDSAPAVAAVNNIQPNIHQGNEKDSEFILKYLLLNSNSKL